MKKMEVRALERGAGCEVKGELTGIVDVDWSNRSPNSGSVYWVMGFTPCLL